MRTSASYGELYARLAWLRRHDALQWASIALVADGINSIYHPAALIFLGLAIFAYSEVRS